MPQNYQIHQPDDRFFKSAMSDPEVAKSYLQYFYPKIAAIADLSTLQQQQVLSVITYILGVAERSPKEFLEQLENTEFTTKPNVMSTLEQLLEMGRKEGLEKGLEKGLDKGIYKNRVFNLLKTAIRFPKLSKEELSNFTELNLQVVATFLSVKSRKDADALKKHILEDLLADVPVSKAEEEKLTKLIEQAQ